MRRFGYVTAILGIVLIVVCYYKAYNSYQIGRETWEAENIFQTGYWYAYILFYASLIAISIGIGIPFVEKQKYAQKQSDELNKDCFSQNQKYLVLLLWIPVIVGAILILANLIGYKINGVNPYRYRFTWGWPILHAISRSDIFLGHPQPISFIRYFSAYWLMVDSFVSIAIILCTTIAVKYIRNRWTTNRQYTLKELLVLVTSTAFLMTFITMERYTHFSNTYIIENQHTYQPVHLLPLYMQIPILIGIACVVMVLGTAFFELFGLAIAKIFRLDDEKD